MTAPPKGKSSEYDTTGVDPDIAPRLMALVSPKRFLHCKRVADMAVSLARRWDLNEDHARRAGLLHDVCRENRDDWQSLASRDNVLLPDWTMGDWSLLHGPLGARLAEREFPLPRPWLDAIANHSWCRPGMTREEQVLHIADHACEGRKYPSVDRWRDLAYSDLDACTLAMLTDLLTSLISQSRALWLPAVETRNELILRARSDSE